MATFIIQVNPQQDSADAFVIYNPSGTPTPEEVRQWAYEGEHGLHLLRLDEEDIIQIDDASESLVDPSSVTGLITELPLPVHSRRKRTAA